MGPVEQVEQVVLAHYAAGLGDLTGAELADAAAEVACLPGELADRMRALVDAERAGRTEQPAPQPQPRPGQPVPGGTPWPDPVQVPRRGPRYLGEDDPMGVLHSRDDDEPVTPIDLPEDAGWLFGSGPGRRVAYRLDGTPVGSSDVIYVPTCPRCEALLGDECNHGFTAAEVAAAPVVPAPEPAFPSGRWLREHHTTAVEWDQMQRGAA